MDSHLKRWTKSRDLGQRCQNSPDVVEASRGEGHRVVDVRQQVPVAAQVMVDVRVLPVGGRVHRRLVRIHCCVQDRSVRKLADSGSL